MFHCQSDEDEPDVDSDFDDGSFSVSDGSNRSSRPKKKPKSSKKKKKGSYGNILQNVKDKTDLLLEHQCRKKDLGSDSSILFILKIRYKQHLNNNSVSLSVMSSQ